MSNLSKYRVQIFGASVDPPEVNKEFAQKNNYNFPLLSDPDKTLARALGVLSPGGVVAMRWTFIIDQDGIIREIDKSVNARTHGKDLAAKLEALGIPKK